MQEKMDKKEILEYFNGKFDKDISRRMKKLKEEFGELVDAFDNGNPDDFVDELADLNAVLFHISGILGFTQDELLDMALDKVKGREKDPNYKRKHPHVENKGCE